MNDRVKQALEDAGAKASDVLMTQEDIDRLEESERYKAEQAKRQAEQLEFLTPAQIADEIRPR